jgi:hypothetical protein
MSTHDYVSARTPEDEEHAAALIRLAEAERQAAYEAVSKAMATYRWWGFTSLLATFRIWLTGVKFRLGMKLWP